MLVSTVANIGGGPHVLLFLINSFLMEKMQFNAFKFSTPLFENIKVLPLGVKSNVLKISPEHSPGSSLVIS